MSVRPISELISRPIAWLWLWRLALGKLAILEGDPGLGKSLLALDLCARLSTGRPFPDGTASPGPGNVIVLNAEDGAEDTIRPRLQALGADLARVYVAHHDEPADLAGVPGWLHALDEDLAHSRALLVVIDPITAFFGAGVLSGSDQSARRALLPLARLAAKHHCAILLVRHLNKHGAGRSIYRGGGSIGIVAACRSGWLAAPDPHAAGRCVLAQVKNNLAPPQPSLAYEVTAQEGAPPVLSWLGPCEWAADDLLAKRPSAPPPSPRDRAREFLEDVLEQGPRTSREIWEASREHELSERTLNRAKRELEVRSVRVTIEGQPRSYWLLPGQELPAVVPPEEAVPSLEPWLAPLRAQFPPPTPLDDL